MIKLVIEYLENPIKSKVKEYFFNEQSLSNCSEKDFLNILNQKYFFIIFQLSISKIENFLRSLNFVKKDDLLFTHASGVAFLLNLSCVNQDIKGYYISELKHGVQRINFHWGDLYNIHHAYNDKNLPVVNLDYAVKCDNLNQIKYISYVNIPPKNISHENSNFIDLLNNNISHIYEYVFDSVIVDNKMMEDISIFDVVYFLPKNDAFHNVICLSELLLSCQFNINKLTNIDVKDLLDIQNILNEDELKIIEMIYA